MQLQDPYPWVACNSFESTKKNCPRGEACLKLKSQASYAWNWAMRCKYNTFLENRDYILESVSKKITITSNRPKVQNVPSLVGARGPKCTAVRKEELEIVLFYITVRRFAYTAEPNDVIVSFFSTY